MVVFPLLKRRKHIVKQITPDSMRWTLSNRLILPLAARLRKNDLQVITYDNPYHSLNSLIRILTPN